MSQQYLALTGRVLLSLIFVLSALSKITDWDSTVQYAATKGLPLIPALLVAAIAGRASWRFLAIARLERAMGRLVAVFLSHSNDARFPQLLGSRRNGAPDGDDEFAEKSGDHGRIAVGRGQR